MKILPVVYSLFGPVENEGSLNQAFSGNVWVFPGAALTVSTNLFKFASGMPAVNRATWRLIWIPNVDQFTVVSRLVNFDDGPTNIAEIARIAGDGSTTPRNSPVDVTTAFNTLITNGVDKNIGYQFWGAEGATISQRIFSSRLEVDWIIS